METGRNFCGQKKLLVFLVAVMLIVKVTVPAYGETLDDDNYTVVRDIQLQQLTSSILLNDGTFLLTGMADDAGVCFLLDQHGNLIHQYRIDAPKSTHSVTVRGAALIGEDIIAATYDYITNTSFIAVISSTGKITITENFSGEIEAVTPLESGLLVCGSYYNEKNKQVPWAAKVGKKGEYEWVFEGEVNQVDAPGTLKHFEFCTEYADEYVLLQHEALGYPNGNVYTMIRLRKDGLPVFRETIHLSKMEFGCLFSNVMVNGETLVLYGGVCASDYQYIATVAAINKSAEVLWLKENAESVGVGAAGNFNGRYYFSLTMPDRLGNTIMIVDELGNTIETFINPFDLLLADSNIKNIISDENDCLWIIGTIENGEYCYIAKLAGQ